jgi:hypothetical protein
MQGANRDQWPKNSHSKMITGIGTPSNQSNNPLAIFLLLQVSCEGENATRRGPFLARIPGADSWRGAWNAYQCPVLGIDSHGSCGGFGSPFCNSSIECRSGERTNAMLPSRGGRLMVTPAFISFSQVA